MKKNILKISSISDVITNSSTEVFVIKPNVGVDRCIRFLEDNRHRNDFEFIRLSTEEDVKWFVLKVAKDGDLWRYDFGPHKLTDEKYQELIEKGMTPDDIWDKYKEEFDFFMGTIVTEASNEDIGDWEDEGVDYDILRLLAENFGYSHRLS